MAQATAIRAGTPTVTDLYVGSVAYFADTAVFDSSSPAPGQADEAHSAVAPVAWDAGTRRLAITSSLLLDGAGLPAVYGVCGIAVGDVIHNSATEDVVVTSLDGHLLVFERESTSGAFGALLHSERVGGALGAYNSIVIADLDGVGGDELYVAGSLGLRQWIFRGTRPPAEEHRPRIADLTALSQQWPL